MAEIRIYELAKKLNISSKAILDVLGDMGIQGKRPASGLSPDVASKVETAVSEKKKSPKRNDNRHRQENRAGNRSDRPDNKSDSHRSDNKSDSHKSESRPDNRSDRSDSKHDKPRGNRPPNKYQGSRGGESKDRNQSRPYHHQRSNQQAHSQTKDGQEGRKHHGQQKPPYQKSHQQKSSQQRNQQSKAKHHQNKEQRLNKDRERANREKFVKKDGQLPAAHSKPPASATKSTPNPVPPTENYEDIVIPARFKEVDKVEKIKPKTGMQRAFQSIRKVELKKVFDSRHNKKNTKGRPPAKTSHVGKQTTPTAPRKKVIKIQEGTTVNEFAKKIGQKLPEVIKKFMELGTMVTINQSVDMDAAMLVAEGFGVKVELSIVEEIDIEETSTDETSLKHRPPVITIMGHVDHGKTSLLDAIRSTKVTEKEAGGITQHIGAYKINLKDKEIVFLDTPGHEAFTSMRARGAKVTDIVVLVVAADDGVMPQTVEAVNHAMAAGVAIVVAINKIDKNGADPSRVKTELSEHNVVPEQWGGKHIFVEVSAKQRIGIEELLEMIILQSEMMELKANHDTAARGIIIESRLDKGRGAVATVLIQSGTLRVGDVFIAGTNYGRVRALIDDDGKKITFAGPSTPVEVLGFSDVPNAGDLFAVVEDEKKARQISIARLQKVETPKAVVGKKLNLDEVYAKIKEQEIKDLNLIVKGDVQGSVEALKSAMDGIKHSEVQVKVIHTGIGGISESDVMLASASNAIILGFNVRADAKAYKVAEKEGVDIRFYNVIYDAIEDIKKALEGLLEPTIKETILGTAEVRQLFNISRIGTIAGCMVTNGLIQRASDGIRIIRDNIVIHDGKISSLKRIKDDVREVNSGYECGIMLDNYNDLKVGDILENYKIEKIASKL